MLAQNKERLYNLPNLSTMKCICILSILGGIFFSSCTDFSREHVIKPQRKRVDLRDPQPGQISYYEMFRACGSSHESTGDTLKLEVIERDGFLYFQEGFTKASPIRSLEWAKEIRTYAINSDGKQFNFPSKSSSFLFWFYEPEHLNLNPAKPTPLIIEECSFDFPETFYEERFIGLVPEFRMASYILLDQWFSPASLSYRNSFLLYTSDELHMSFFLSISFSRGFRLIHPGMDRI